MQEEDGLRVEEDGVDVLVGAGRVLAAGRHLERPQETGDQDLQLVHVLLLRLDHSEDQAGKKIAQWLAYLLPDIVASGSNHGSGVFSRKNSEVAV